MPLIFLYPQIGVPRQPRVIPILTTPMRHTFGTMATGNGQFPAQVRALFHALDQSVVSDFRHATVMQIAKQ